MTDFQRLRRNVLREIHDHSAPRRMLFSYEKMEPRGAEIWDSLLAATNEQCTTQIVECIRDFANSRSRQKLERLAKDAGKDALVR